MGEFFLLSVLAGSALGQNQPLQRGRQQASGPGIQDNSFLIEEAYNQEEGVVQHIFNLNYVKDHFLFVFTQEWPLNGQANQISYTIPYESLNANTVHGFGDVLINYRYQLFFDGEWASVAPRLSVIIPTGNENLGLGDGSIGVQTSIPVSKEISPSFVAHANAGCTVILRKQISYYGGGSLIWRAEDDVHFILETVVSSNVMNDSNGAVERKTEVVISPGLRFALNFPSLQVVPGVGMPLWYRDGEIEGGLFLYLSFEHTF